MSAAECTCYRVENPWTYYGIVEPGGAMEPNPDCRVHFPATFTIFEFATIAAELTALHAGGTLSYGDTLVLLNTADRMAKAALA